MICELCNKEFFIKYASGRFCSKECSHSFSTKSKRKEINEKVSKALSGRRTRPLNICAFCQNEFNGRPGSKFCCRNHSARHIMSRPDVKYKINKKLQERIAAGNGPQWKSRSKLEPSYPEKFWMKVLQNNKIEFIHELKCDKYFIDFAIESKKVALEIDGTQHNFEDRKISDGKKDITLKENGWKVYRIKWLGTKKVKPQIDEFLFWYSNL